MPLQFLLDFQLDPLDVSSISLRFLSGFPQIYLQCLFHFSQMPKGILLDFFPISQISNWFPQICLQFLLDSKGDSLRFIFSFFNRSSNSLNSTREGVSLHVSSLSLRFQTGFPQIYLQFLLDAKGYSLTCLFKLSQILKGGLLDFLYLFLSFPMGFLRFHLDFQQGRLDFSCTSKGISLHVS